jgi:RNA polymerase sigma-70 factor (ECF subfamily)
MSIVFQAMHAVSGLFARAKRSEEVVNAFLQNERPWMYRLALSITQRPDLAEDAVQETLIRCWRSTKKLTTVDDLKAFCRQVLVRRAITALKAHSSVELPEVEDAKVFGEQVDVRLVMQSLPADSRAILSLSYFEGLSYQEISDTLGIPAGTVASRLSTARERFRDAWEAK